MSDHDDNHEEKTAEAPARKSESDRTRSEPNEQSERSKPEPDGNDTKDEKKGDEKKSSGGPPKKVLIIAAIVFVVLALGGLLYYLHARNYESTDDAFVAGHLHEISARIPGTVWSVLVNDNQVVHKGDPLVTLDPREFNLALEKARAQLLQARASVTQADAEIEQRVAATAQASAQLEKAMTDYNRASALFSRDIKAVSKAEVDSDAAALKSAQGAFSAAKANEDAARAQKGVAEAGITTAQTAVDDAELQLSYTKIAAPVDGSIAKKTVEVGRRLQPGQALMAVVEPNVWIVANLKETQLAKVKIGQTVAIEIDAVPRHTFQGHVDSFQSGTGAVFSLLPPDNATGNFTKIVQRLPVKIVFDRDSISGFQSRVRPGLSAAPKIDLRSR